MLDNIGILVVNRCCGNCFGRYMNNQVLVLLTQHGNVEIGILLVDNFLVEPNIKFTGDAL